ncbi:hypothetical protein J3E69DRAFT_320464 [Trichoderma sp. SZMC 28015]
MILLGDSLTPGGWLLLKILAFILAIWPKKSTPVPSFLIPYFCLLFPVFILFFFEGEGEKGEAAIITLQARFITSASVFIQLRSSIPKLPQQPGFLQGHNISWSEAWSLLCLVGDGHT